ncbi:MAG: phenylalanine--tRNA ligase subunit beta [Candidatus Omnitrophica bacterium]|nr:phenylalanine--tRNA ligase subunit beta [Candidatus Omnitrophota bacterium]
MKISYDWIRKYVPIKMRAQNLAEKLTMAGLEITGTDKRGDDFIFELEITSNRPDWLSHIGIAREVSAITKKPLNIPQISLQKYFSADIKKPQVILQENVLCPRYTARLITGLAIGPSPKWLIGRIEAMGLRAVNNVVDITNFVLFETGQPLHAFDYDKLKGKKIIIRTAKAGEEIITIDGEKRKFQPQTDQPSAGKKDTLVIADENTPVAIAGIMGGLNTEVTSSTKNILLESAYFDPVCIRRASKFMGLSTDSSYRFERSVDIGNIINASDRAAALICAIAKAKTHQGIVDLGKKTNTPVTITLRPDRVYSLLGVRISSTEIKSILTRLGFKVKSQANSIKVIVPSFRKNDIIGEADLVEEIARIYGYNNIPMVMPRAIVTEESESFKQKNKITAIVRSALASLGFNEMLTYSLISKDDIKKLDMPELDTISLQNPLSEQYQIMRTSLLNGALKAASHNINMGNLNLKLFELSNVYHKENNVFTENMNLSLILCGDTASDWNKKPRAMDIFYLKGALTTLFNAIGVDAAFQELSHHPCFDSSEALAITAGNKIIGVIGRVQGAVLRKIDIKKDIYAAEINAELLFENSRPDKHFNAIVKFPGSYRDVSMSVDSGVSFESISMLIKEANRSIIKDVFLQEEYRGDKIAEGKRNLLIRVYYQSKEKTLAEAEIEAADGLIRKKLIDNFNATLR